VNDTHGSSEAHDAELQEGRYLSSSNISWQEFRERYAGEKLASLAMSTADSVATAICRPKDDASGTLLAQSTPKRGKNAKRAPASDRRNPF
jgi:hypothetical protein